MQVRRVLLDEGKHSVHCQGSELHSNWGIQRERGRKKKVSYLRQSKSCLEGFGDYTVITGGTIRYEISLKNQSFHTQLCSSCASVPNLEQGWAQVSSADYPQRQLKLKEAVRLLQTPHAILHWSASGRGALCIILFLPSAVGMGRLHLMTKRYLVYLPVPLLFH